jgi:hypothetical protein
MLVPRPADEAEADTYDLAPMDDAGPASLLDSDVPAAGGTTLRGPPPPRPQAELAQESVERRPKASAQSELVTRLGPVVGLGGLVALPVVIILVVVWSVMRPGYGSPEDAFAAHQQALLEKDWGTLIHTYSPESREMLLDRMLEIVSWRSGQSSPEIEAALKKHGIAEIMERDTPAPAAEEAGADAADVAEDAPEEPAPIDYQQLARKKEERRKKLLASVEDKAALYVDLNEAIQAMVERNLPENPMLAVYTKKPVEEARRLVARADFTDLEFDGDTAEGKLTFKPSEEDQITVPVRFKKIGGRWYVHTPGLDHYDEPEFRALIGGGWL